VGPESRFCTRYFEACLVDGSTYCGTYRPQLPIPEGEYPVYKNQHGRYLWRHLTRFMWVLDSQEYSPELAVAEHLHSGEASYGHKASTALPSTAVPMGSNQWQWASPPPKQLEEWRKNGMLMEGSAHHTWDDLTLTVTGLIDEDEVGA